MGIVGALLALPIAAGLQMVVRELRVELPGESPHDARSRARDEKAEHIYERLTEGATAADAGVIAGELAAEAQADRGRRRQPDRADRRDGRAERRDRGRRRPTGRKGRSRPRPDLGSLPMKGWKFFVLLAGAFGIYGFFQPFYRYHSPHLSAHVSAYQIVHGVDAPNQIIDGADDNAEAHEAIDAYRARVERTLGKLAGVAVALYVPAAMLVMLGLTGIVRRRFGRLSGGLTFAVGLIACIIWGAGFAVAALESNRAHKEIFSAGLGLHALAIAGVTAMICGVGALLRPQTA